LDCRVEENCNRRRQYERRGSNSLIGRGIAGSHRTIAPHWVALRVAIALVLLQIADLAMVHGAIGRIAAGERIGGLKRLGKRWRARCQQRKKRHDRQKLSRVFSQFHELSMPKNTLLACLDSTAGAK
jgi:hypothetical protein